MKREPFKREEANISLSSIKEEKEESNFDKTSPKKPDDSIEHIQKPEESDHEEYTGFEEQNELNKNPPVESDHEEMDEMPKTYGKLKTEKSVKIDYKMNNQSKII